MVPSKLIHDILFLEIQTPVPDSSTMENTTGDVISPPPLPSDDPVRGATGVLSPTSPTTDTEHTTGDCTNKTNISFFCMINNTFSFTLTITFSTKAQYQKPMIIQIFTYID